MGQLAVQVGEGLNAFFPDTCADVLPAREDGARGRLEWFAAFYPSKFGADATP